MRAERRTPNAESRLDLSTLIAGCRLMQCGGYTVTQSLLTDTQLRALQEDAAACAPHAVRMRLDESRDCEGRGGQPARAYRYAEGTGLQYEILTAPAFLRALTELVGLRLEALGAGTYSFYDEEGDFLALHRDVEACDAALVTCLGNEPHRGGGLLRLHPRLADPSFRIIDTSPNASHAAIDLDLTPGESALLLGGIIPHEVTPTVADQRRVVSIACYRITGPLESFETP
jgi:hypothetical protein